MHLRDQTQSLVHDKQELYKTSNCSLKGFSVLAFQIVIVQYNMTILVTFWYMLSM